MKIKRGVIAQKLGDIFVAYDNETGTLLEFNEVGFVIFREIKKGKNNKEIVKALTAEFSVSYKEAARDFDDFVKKLTKRDLIVDKK